MMPNPTVEEDLRRIHRAVGQRRDFESATVLMTGCGGFLGFYLMQYLVRYAVQLGLRQVIGLDNFLLEKKPAWLRQLEQDFPSLFSLHSFDISRDSLKEVEHAQEARYVLHAASIASPTFYRRYPLETIDANVWGLRRLLDFYRREKELKGFLFFSSSEIYGDPPPDFLPTGEEYRGNVACVGPRACYDESKRFGETLCYVFAETYGLPVTVVRPFNNYGPGMRRGDNRLPADLADCVLTGREIVLHSDGSPTRAYCYVSDAAAGYVSCLLHGKHDVFNIGADQPELSVRELAEMYRRAGAEMLGYSAGITYAPSRDHHYLTDNPGRRCPDLGKARDTLGYNPEIDIEEGVRRHLVFLRGTDGQT